MGILSCCVGRQRVKEEEVLLPWAPLPLDLQPTASANQRRGWRSASQRSDLAPAFGEGALREDEWAPQFTRTYKKRSGRYGYDSLDVVAPPSYPAAAKPRPPSPPAAAAVPAPRAPSPAPVSRAPFVAAPTRQAQGQADGGWGSEPEWLREAALAAAAESAPTSKAASGTGGGVKLAHLFSRDRSGENSSDSAGGGAVPPKRQARKAAASPQRPRGGGAHDKPLRAPAFGENALTKWH
ncbi:hypothetical protein ABPG75_013988 [Micractinium tetrahymenae]